VSFEEPVSTQAGPPSSASTQAARSSSIQAAVPATQAGPIPSIQVTLALSAPLSIYRPASCDHPGPPSALQAAFAAAPKPKSFLDLIAQTEAIVGANSRGNPLSQPVSNPVDPAMGMTSAAGPSWPTDIITPPLEPAIPVYKSAAAIAPGHVTQLVGPTLPSVSSSATTSSGRSAPHLGTSLFASSSTAPGSSLYAAQFAGPALPAANYATTGTPGRSTPHLGTGLSASGTAAAATSIRLAQMFETPAHPYQPNPYDDHGNYLTEPEPLNQLADFGGHSPYQPTHYDTSYQSTPYGASYQPTPYDGHAMYQPVPESLAQQVRYGGSSAYYPSHFEERATYGPEHVQHGQPATSTATDHQHPPYDARQLYSPSPEQLAESSGSGDSSANEPSPYDLRETYEPESEGISAATARLKKAEDDHALSLLRLQIRRQQLQNEQQTQRQQQLRNQERNDRLQQEEERQWRLLDQQEYKNSRRR
jgi:hypothetical protein